MLALLALEDRILVGKNSLKMGKSSYIPTIRTRSSIGAHWESMFSWNIKPQLILKKYNPQYL